MKSSQKRISVHLTTLGCPKNRVDSEHILGMMLKEHYHYQEDPQKAEMIIVNTCGFIHEAKQESIDTIIEMAEYKNAGACRTLIVTGCLSQLYGKDLKAEIPELDYVLGIDAYQKLPAILESAANRQESETNEEWEHPERLIDFEPKFLHTSSMPRVNSLFPHSAYLKISEGCNNTCSFCTIPKIRGKQRSRSIDDLTKEAQNLANQGVKEINLLAQDLTAYGYDLNPKTSLGYLLQSFVEIENIEWIRLHYAYPRPFSPKLWEMLQHPKVCKYIDIPLQHISDSVLKLMKRGHNTAYIMKKLHELRSRLNGLYMRTSFVVGFPGETDHDFQQLVDFVKDQQFDWMGVFEYSNEEHSAAYQLSDQVPDHIKKERRHILMELQKQISQKKLQQQIGKKLVALVDGVSEETDLLLEARHYGMAPKVDGKIYINDGIANIGDFVRVKIEEAHEYDLIAKICNIDDTPYPISHPACA